MGLWMFAHPSLQRCRERIHAKPISGSIPAFAGGALMVCKTCHQDLAPSFFEARVYSIGLANACPQHCSTCMRLPKATKREINRAWHEKNRLVSKPPKAKNRKHCRAGVAQEDAAWRRMTPTEKHASMLMRRTPTELRLGEALEAAGIGFSPQVPCGPYFIDLAIPAHRIAIECDGGYHFTLDQADKDAKREHQIRCHNWRVIRFTNEQINVNLEGVMESIRQLMSTPIPSKAANKRALAGPPIIGWHVAPCDTSFNPDSWLDAIARDRT
jgi:very-short-patch-repair endonuclease